MPSYLDSVAAKIADSAGWRQPTPDAQGAYRFSLQGDLELQLFSPDGNTIIFWAKIQDLPEEEFLREDLLAAQAQRAVAACKERRTTLALEENMLILQAVVNGKTAELDELPGLAEAFLNDLAWWKKQAARLTA